MRTTNYDLENPFNFPPIQLDRLHWFSKESLGDIPVVDMQKLNSKEELTAFINEVLEKKIFCIENHGIEEYLIEELLNVHRAFFSLSEEEKAKFVPPDMKIDVAGYKGFKKGSVAKVSGTGESFDQLMQYVFSVHNTDVTYPNETFGRVCKLYTEKVTALIRLLLEKLFDALQLIPSDFTYTKEVQEFFLEKGFTRNMTLLYPAVEQDEDARERMTSHYDTSLITILYQIPTLGKFSEDPYIGFELEEEGERIPIPPVRGTFLVNFGELIHHLTNGVVEANYHGVRIPTEEELPESERMTIVSFYFPDPQTKLKLSKIKGSISYNAIQNGDLKEGQEVTLEVLRKAMFKKYFTY